MCLRVIFWSWSQIPALILELIGWWSSNLSWMSPKNNCMWWNCASGGWHSLLCCSPLVPVVLDIFFLHIDFGSLYVPICTQRGRSNFCCFVIGYSTLFLLHKSGGELVSLKESFLGSSSPWIWWQVLLQAAWRVTGRGEIPALSWFGFWPEIAPHKIFKEVLEYLSKRRLRIVFVHFQQLHPCLQQDPGCQLRSGAFAISFQQRKDSEAGPKPQRLLLLIYVVTTF